MRNAAQRGHQAVIKLLLDSGADIEARGDDGHTPLMRAMLANQSEAVRLLVTRGATIADGRAAATGAAFGSIVALKTLMTSPQWLLLSRTQRI